MQKDRRDKDQEIDSLKKRLANLEKDGKVAAVKGTPARKASKAKKAKESQSVEEGTSARKASRAKQAKKSKSVEELTCKVCQKISGSYGSHRNHMYKFHGPEGPAKKECPLCKKMIAAGNIAIHVQVQSNLIVLSQRIRKIIQIQKLNTVVPSWVPTGYSQIFISYVFGTSGFWTMAPLRYTAIFDSFLSLDCATHLPPWRNPKKGRDQILPSCNHAYHHIA